MLLLLTYHELRAPAGSHGGNYVTVEGSFDNWSTRHVMQRSGKDFTIVKLLPPGVYQARPYPLTHPSLHGMLLLRSAQLHVVLERRSTIMAAPAKAVS